MTYFAVIAAAYRAFDFFGFSRFIGRSQYAIDIGLKGIAAFLAKGIHRFILIIISWHKAPFRTTDEVIIRYLKRPTVEYKNRWVIQLCWEAHL